MNAETAREQPETRGIGILRSYRSAVLAARQNGLRHPILNSSNYRRALQLIRRERLLIKLLEGPLFSGLRQSTPFGDIIRFRIANLRFTERPFRNARFGTSESRLKFCWSDSIFAGRKLPREIIRVGRLIPKQQKIAKEFLSASRTAELSDENLFKRMDGACDRVGQLLTDLATELELLATSQTRLDNASLSGSMKVIFDARALQEAGLRNRGIGRFSIEILSSLKKQLGPEQITLLVDPYQEPLETAWLEGHDTVLSTRDLSAAEFSLLVQPSPMTSSVEPLLPALLSGMRALAVVYDFIPAEFPEVYLRDPGDTVRYASQLRALEKYSDILTISHAVKQRLSDWIPRSQYRNVTVAWPAEYLEPPILPSIDLNRDSPESRCLLVSAMEARKTPLAALEAIRRLELRTDLLGFGSTPDAAKSLIESIWTGETQPSALPHLSESEKLERLKRADVVIVPSFAEGLSLPVIEAVRAGSVVVASDIAAHRELLGKGPWLVTRNRPDEWQKAIEAAISHRTEFLEKQTLSLKNHSAENVSAVLEALFDDLGHTSAIPAKAQPANPPSKTIIAPPNRTKPNLGVFTPWPSQRTGVADYSHNTIPHLASSFNVTIYTSGSVPASAPLVMESPNVPILSETKHDYFLTVMGSSPFHLPGLEIMRRVQSAVLCHDSKAIDFYQHFGGVVTALHVQGQSVTQESVDNFWTSLKTGNPENLGFGELAGLGRNLIFHSQPISERVAHETGARTTHVPFVPLRKPPTDWNSSRARAAAKVKLDAPTDTFNIISVGFIDDRSKHTLKLAEACELLIDRGERLRLTFVGQGSPAEIELLRATTASGVRPWLDVTGFVDESTMVDYMLAADLCVQLRSGELQMLSGPVFDCGAFGLRTLLTENLSDSGSLPFYQVSTPNVLDSLTLADSIQRVLHSPVDERLLEDARREFVEARSPEKYGVKLAELILDR